MASTYDALLRLELQQTGENANSWGEKTNTNLELIAEAIAGSSSINIAGSGNFTLTAENAAADQSRKMYLTLTGTLTGARAIIIPTSSKIYVVYNNTSGAFAVTIKTASGVAATLPQGFATIVACNGTDCLAVNEVARVSKAGDTMTGQLTLPGNPSNDLHAVTKAYVDAATGTNLSNYFTKTEADARFVESTGDTMTGFLTLHANPSNNLHAATKQYVDNLIGSSSIPIGVITMWSGSILSIPIGWALCNGTGGTPDLRDRFIVGAGNTLVPGQTGGSVSPTLGAAGAHTHTASTSTAGAHTHSASSGTAGAHTHGGATGSTTLTTSQIPSHSHAVSIMPSGSEAAGYGLTETAAFINRVLVTNFITSTTPAGGGGGHTHTISSDGSHSHSITVGNAGDHTHTITVEGVGDHTHPLTDGRPPYYSLAYIMKIS